jgi:hypothetical protein
VDSQHIEGKLGGRTAEMSEGDTDLSGLIQHCESISCNEDNTSPVPPLPICSRIFDVGANIFWQTHKLVYAAIRRLRQVLANARQRA